MIMMLKPNILALSLLLPVLVSVFLAVNAWRPRYAPRGKTFGLLMFALAIWSAAYGLELASTDFNSMIFWLKIEYIGIPYISALMVLVILQFVGINFSISKKQTLLLFIVPFITMLLSLTFTAHTFYYKEVSFDDSGSFPLLKLTPGIWYYVHVIYSYILVIYAITLMAKKLYYQKSLFRNQLIFMLIAVLIPFITFTFYFAGWMPVKNLDPTPFAFALSGLAISVNIFKFRMLDLMPIAREHIFRSMNDGLVVLDNKGRFVECNPMALKIFNRKETPVGMRAIDLWPDHPNISDIINDQEVRTIEINTFSNDSTHYYLVSSSKIYNHKNETVGKLIIMHDITQRHNLQETIRKSEEKLRLMNAEKDKLFSIIAHDLKGPLGSFSGLTELFITDDDITPDEMKEIASKMNQSAQSLNTLLDNLLQWSRMQRDDMSIHQRFIKVHPLVDKVLEISKEPIAKKELFVRNMVNIDIQVFADENMLDSVFRNLISNAIKFTPKGGNIVVTAKQTATEVLISIRDTGIGMPKKMIEHLYSFEHKNGRPGTEGEPSTGLGLVLCKDFIERNDGQLFVESEEGKGTVFSFSLPITKPENISF